MTLIPVLAATAVVALVPPVRKRAFAVAGTTATAALATGAAVVGAAAGLATVAVEGLSEVGRAAITGSPGWDQAD